MLLGMLVSFVCESTEVVNDVSLMYGYENGKHEGYGNERKFFVVCFFCLKDNAECFLSFCFFEG